MDGAGARISPARDTGGRGNPDAAADPQAGESALEMKGLNLA